MTERFLGLQPRGRYTKEKYKTFLEGLAPRKKKLDTLLSVTGWGGLGLAFFAGGVSWNPPLLLTGLGISLASGIAHRKIMNKAAKEQGYSEPLFQF